MRRSPVRVRPQAPECVDERCSTENTARKCGVFAYLTPFYAGKSSKKRFFRKISFSTREATFQRCIGTFLWTGATRTPRLQKRIKRQNHGIPNLRGNLPAHQASLGARDAPHRESFPAGLRAEPTHAGAENTMEQNAHTEAPVAPLVANETAPIDTDTPNEDNAV